MIRNISIEIICFLFILLFVYAAISKLIDLDTFKAQIGQSPLLTRYAGFASVGVPILELIVSGSLILPAYRETGLYVSFGMMCLFTLYVLYVMNLSDYVPCSCGGILSKMSWGVHLWFNIVFTVIGLIGIVLNSSKINEQITSINHETKVKI